MVGHYNALQDPQVEAQGILPLLKRAFAGEHVHMPDVEYDPAASGLPGEKRWIWTHASPIRTEDGDVKFLIVLNEDITERKKTEEQVLQTTERYRAFSELSSDYVYSASVSPQGNVAVEWVGEAFQRITGYSADMVRNLDTWMSVIHPDDRSSLAQVVQVALTNASTSNEYRIRTATDEERWLLDRTRPVWDEAQQRVVRILGTVQDITDRKRFEAHLVQLTIEQERVKVLRTVHWRCFARSTDTTHGAQDKHLPAIQVI